jgi:hypothetical protein
MKQILVIDVSPRGDASASRSVADALATRLSGLHPSAKLIRRDLAVEPRGGELRGRVLRGTAIVSSLPFDLRFDDCSLWPEKPGLGAVGVRSCWLMWRGRAPSREASNSSSIGESVRQA